MVGASVTVATREDGYEVEVVSSRPACHTAAPDLLFELPHGATRERHFEALRRRLTGPLPEDLKQFFFVNTDVGAPECARTVAELIAGRRPLAIAILRCLIPRTLIDCNRVVDGATGSGDMTSAIPDYIDRPADTRLLVRLHESYQAAARQLYERVCAAGGLALQLHTYAPRSVRLDRVDHGIVEALRAAYEPDNYAGWEPRPDVDVISRAADGVLLASPTLVAALRQQYAREGIEARENATYHLHPETLGYRHSVRYPGQVLCVELNRARLADPFSPFEEMRIGVENVRRMAGPLADAVLAEVVRRA